MGISVDRKLLPIKAHYFFFNAGTAPVVPFMATFARQLGFTTTVVGTIYTFLPIFGLIVKPLFGALADRYQRQKLFFILFQLITAVAYFGLMFVPGAPPVIHEVNLKCGDGATEFESCTTNWTLDDTILATGIDKQYVNYTMRCDMICELPTHQNWDTICTNWFPETKPELCRLNHMANTSIEFTAFAPINDMVYPTTETGSCIYFRITEVQVDDQKQLNPYCPKVKNFSNHINAKCDAVCDLVDVNELLVQIKNIKPVVATSYQFWWLFIGMSLSWIGMAVVVSVSDTICFEMLGENGHLYGKQRLWGSIGWGIFSFLTGVLVDYFSGDGLHKNYNICFYLMAVLLLFDMFVSTKLKYTQSSVTTNIIQGIGTLLIELRIVIFLLFCIMVGMCTALIWNFLFWHLENLAETTGDSGSIKTLEGVLMAIQMFGGELPMFFLSGTILKKLGHIYTMHLVLFAIALRVLLYSFLSNPWLCLPIELLHGVSFGLFYATMASYASIVAPLGTETTIQGLVGGVFEGVGVALGSFIGGYMMENIGGVLTFRYFSLATLVFLVFHVLVHFCLQKRGKIDFQNTKAFQSQQARYAIPADAIQMVDDDLEIPLETY